MLWGSKVSAPSPGLRNRLLAGTGDFLRIFNCLHLKKCFMICDWPLRRWGWLGQCWSWSWRRWGPDQGWTSSSQKKDNRGCRWKRLIINSNLKYSPAQDGNNYEPTGERRCSEEEFKKLTPPTWEGKSLPAPDLQLRTLGQGHYCQCVENSANDIFWLVGFCHFKIFTIL